VRLSWKQLVASVSGAVLAAFALASLGATGTILGVALGSAAATVGSAIAFQSLEKGHQKVRGLVVKDAISSHPVPPPPSEPMTEFTGPGDLESVMHPAQPVPPPLYGGPKAPGRTWSLIAIVAMVFGVSLAFVTVIELTLGESFSTVLGTHNSDAKTSIGGLFGGGTTTTSSTTTTAPAESTTTTSTTTTSTSTTTPASSTSTTAP